MPPFSLCLSVCLPCPVNLLSIALVVSHFACVCVCLWRWRFSTPPPPAVGRWTLVGGARRRWNALSKRTRNEKKQQKTFSITEVGSRGLFPGVGGDDRGDGEIMANEKIAGLAGLATTGNEPLVPSFELPPPPIDGAGVRAPKNASKRFTLFRSQCQNGRNRSKCGKSAFANGIRRRVRATKSATGESLDSSTSGCRRAPRRRRCCFPSPPPPPPIWPKDTKTHQNSTLSLSLCLCAWLAGAGTQPSRALMRHRRPY